MLTNSIYVLIMLTFHTIDDICSAPGDPKILC